MLFAAVHEAAYVTSRHFTVPQNLSSIGLTTDKGPLWCWMAPQRMTQSGHKPSTGTTVEKADAFQKH